MRAQTLGHARLAMRPERGSELFGKQVRLFPGGEVAAPLGLMEVDDVGIELLSPGARCSEDLAGERGEADRECDYGSSLADRESLGAGALPVRAGCRGPGTRQPVQRDVVEDVVPGKVARGLAAGKGAGDLVIAVGVVVEHPGRKRDR